jgi:hypothetical protein
MLRVLAGLVCLLFACPERPEPDREAETRTVPPSADEGRIIDLTAQGGAGSATGTPRELQPREGHDSCTEMYTVCIPDRKGENCTSGRLLIECGDLAKVPTTGEQLKCVCP